MIDDHLLGVRLGKQIVDRAGSVVCALAYDQIILLVTQKIELFTKAITKVA